MDKKIADLTKRVEELEEKVASGTTSDINELIDQLNKRVKRCWIGGGRDGEIECSC